MCCLSHERLCFVSIQPPYSLRVDECSEYICFNGQLMLHNSSQHCRYNISQPQCNLLGTPIQINTDPAAHCGSAHVRHTHRALSFALDGRCLYLWYFSSSHTIIAFINILIKLLYIYIYIKKKFFH